jgi:hypothetical protein
MKELFLTREQVNQLTQRQAEMAMKRLAKTYDLERPLTECFEQVWPDLDQIVDTILYLEDRIAYTKMTAQLDLHRPQNKIE